MTPQTLLQNAGDEFQSFLQYQLWYVEDRIESPIERLFAAALISRDWWQGWGAKITLERLEVKFGSIEPDEREGTRVWLQPSVGPYRADFLIRHTSRDRVRWLIVECDGHAFHHATKKQVARDRKRDRYFTSIGLPFLRFTGSEIFRDPVSCACEALDVVTGKSDV